MVQATPCPWAALANKKDSDNKTAQVFPRFIRCRSLMLFIRCLYSILDAVVAHQFTRASAGQVIANDRPVHMRVITNMCLCFEVVLLMQARQRNMCFVRPKAGTKKHGASTVRTKAAATLCC
jgi:hypothetical protein